MHHQEIQCKAITVCNIATVKMIMLNKQKCTQSGNLIGQMQMLIPGFEKKLNLKGANDTAHSLFIPKRQLEHFCCREKVKFFFR